MKFMNPQLLTPSPAAARKTIAHCEGWRFSLWGVRWCVKGKSRLFVHALIIIDLIMLSKVNFCFGYAKSKENNNIIAIANKMLMMRMRKLDKDKAEDFNIMTFSL